MKVWTVGLADGAEAEWVHILVASGHQVVTSRDAAPGEVDLVLLARRAAFRFFASAGRLACPVLILPETEGESKRPRRQSQIVFQIALGMALTAKTQTVVADLRIDRRHREVVRAGRKIPLTGREFQILDLLATNVGHALSRDAIHSAVWGDEARNSNHVDAHIANLRKKIDQPFSTPLIHTVVGFGYVLREPGA